MAFFTQSKAVRYLLGISGPTILALGLWLLLLATNPGRNETIDVGVRLAVTRQLWTAGKVAVDRPHVIEGLWIEIAPDRYVAPYGIGQSLVFVPFDMVSSVLEHFTPKAWRGQLPWLPIGFGLLPLLGLGYWYALRRLPPPPVRDFEGCSTMATMATMWDRYIPNFWGPVYAHRLARSDKWILLFWSMLFGASLLAIGVGLRRHHHSAKPQPYDLARAASAPPQRAD
jgi:hypothetical protein